MTKLSKLPPSTTQSPLWGSTTLRLTEACVNASPFREHEQLESSAVGGKPFVRLYRFLERHAFREGAHLRAIEAIDSKNDLVEKGSQLIYSTSDRAVTGSFAGSISVLTLERLGVAFSYEQWRNNVLFNDDRDGTLKQSNGNDQMVLILDPQENPLRTHEWTSLQPDPLPRSQKGPRLNRTSGQRNGSDGSDFMVIHWLRPIPRPHNSYHAWSD